MPSDHPDTFARQVEHLFEEAFDLPAAARARFVEERADGNSQLASSVLALLRAAANENTAWGRSAFEHEAKHLAIEGADSEQDACLERYRLEERIGAGGMGVVYRAVRADDEFAKRVAIKIVQRAVAEPRLAERFRTERQILAGLEHPNIVRMLDGGATEDGRPFLVMEYVEGINLDKYLAAHALSTPAKLAMFRKICDGVACAHRSLVVHRDLKPSNILVTADGEPKLLDFGIAKLLDGRAATETGYGAMTPQYASPEQIANASVTTSSDIYSLGVILYEMLSGTSPYPTTSALELAQGISAAAPLPMRDIARDLETILQMALRKEPARRYASVEQFSADIQRYLDGFPVTAQTDTLLYRTRKFVGRNKISVAAAAVAVAALLGGIVSTVRQASIANQRFNDVRRLANSYLFEIHDAIQSLPGSTAARQLLAKRAQEYLDSLSRQKSDDPGLLKELAVAYEKLADVQGRREQGNIGDAESAKRNFRKALALREQLYSANPDDTIAVVDLAHSLLLVGNDELAQRKLASAEAYIRRAISLNEKPGKAGVANDIPSRETLGVACQLLGDVLGHPRFSSLGQSGEALRMYQRSLDLFENNAQAASSHKEKKVFIAATMSRIAQLRQALNEGSAAMDAYRGSLANFQSLSAAAPDNAFYRLNVAIASRNLAVATVQILSDPAAATPLMEQSVETLELMAQADPADVGVQAALADTYSAQGILLGKGAPAARLKYFDRALARFETIVKSHPGFLKPDATLTTHEWRTDALLDLRRYPEATESVQRQLETDNELLRLSPANAFAIRNQATASGQMALAYERQGQGNEARDWYRRALNSYLAQQKNGTFLPVSAARMDAARQALDRPAQ